MKFFPLGIIILAILCIAVAALMKASLAKGRMRMAGSLLAGCGFVAASVQQVLASGKLWPGSVGSLIGLFLIWFGVRKRRRDPEGTTPAGSIL